MEDTNVYAAYARFAALYDLLMQDVDYGAWADYLDNLMRSHTRAIETVLDCACGTGEMTLHLARRGYGMTGLDISCDMLFIAQEKARSAGLSIPFVQGDMRRIRLHRPVDAIVCVLDGVNYLKRIEDVGAFVRSAHAALKPGGLLLFDCSSRYKLSEILGGNTFAEALGDCAYIWENNYDPELALCEMVLTCFQKKGMLYARSDEIHVQRAHTVDEILSALEAAGFHGVCAYEAFTREAPGDAAERVQYVARRA